MKNFWLGLLNDAGEEIRGAGYCRQIYDPEQLERNFPRARGPWGRVSAAALFRECEGADKPLDLPRD